MNSYMYLHKFLLNEKGFYIEYDLIKVLIERFKKEKNVEFTFNDVFFYQYDNELVRIGKQIIIEEEENRLIELLSKKLKISIKKDEFYGNELKISLEDKEIFNQYL